MINGIMLQKDWKPTLIGLEIKELSRLNHSQLFDRQLITSILLQKILSYPLSLLAAATLNYWATL